MAKPQKTSTRRTKAADRKLATQWLLRAEEQKALATEMKKRARMMRDRAAQMREGPRAVEQAHS